MNRYQNKKAKNWKLKSVKRDKKETKIKAKWSAWRSPLPSSATHLPLDPKRPIISLDTYSIPLSKLKI